MTESNQKSEMILALKSAVLNIDWEISDDTLQELNCEIEVLRKDWAGEKALLVYLQILAALSQYIGSSREKSHPGTFLLLREAFESLEEVVVAPDMELADKNSRVLVFADRYNQLKKEIAACDFTPGPAKEQDDEKSTMDELLDDDGDHSTDTVFDSMLNAMVKTPAEDDVVGGEVEEAEPEAETPKAPPARPPVQARFNKEDGTEVEPDRNVDDEFAEADELLDDFFDDDDIPAPSGDPVSDDAVLDLGEVAVEEEAAGEESEEILVIDIDEEVESEEDEDSFQEMEDTLDTFFGEDDDGTDLLDPVEDTDDDVALIDEALDDFFDDEPSSEAIISDGVAEGSAAEEVDADMQLVVDDGSVANGELALGIDNDVDEELLIDDAVLTLDEDEDGAGEILELESESESEDPAELQVALEVELGATDGELELEGNSEGESEVEANVEPDVNVEPEAEAEKELEGEAETEAEFDQEPEDGANDELKDEAKEEIDGNVESEGDSADGYGAEKVDLDLEDEPQDEETDSEPVMAGEAVAVPVVAEAEFADGGRLVENLQALLLSVEWEVDDQLLLRLQEEIESLSVVLKENAAAALHLNFLGAVIRYINQEQAEVISDSMICLKLIADSLEALLGDQSSDGVAYGAEAARLFVDWHELVVLDFEKRLHLPEDEVEDSAPAPAPALSAEMEELRQRILEEVRELITLELSEAKG